MICSELEVQVTRKTCYCTVQFLHLRAMAKLCDCHSITPELELRCVCVTPWAATGPRSQVSPQKRPQRRCRSQRAALPPCARRDSAHLHAAVVLRRPAMLSELIIAPKTLPQPSGSTAQGLEATKSVVLLPPRTSVSRHRPRARGQAGSYSGPS